MRIRDSELKNIVAEVEQTFTSMMKSEQEALAKAKGDEEPAEAGAAGEGGEASGVPEASVSAPAEGSAPEASASAPPAGPETSASAPPGADGSAPPAGPEASAPPGADDGSGGGDLDPAAIKAELAKVPTEQLKVYYMAVRSELEERLGSEASPEGSAPPAGPEASAPAAPPAGPPAMKAEIKPGAANGGNIIKKSEDTETKAKVDELQKQVDLLVKALDLSLGQPIRKAVTSVTEPEAPAAPEVSVKEKISRALRSNKLTKNQKEDLFSFSLGNKKYEDIEGILNIQ